MTADHRRFSVFLVPAAEDRRWAEGVIRELAARYDAPPFEPHVTVYGGRFVEESELEPVHRALADAAAETGPITLRITGFGATAEYFKTLFVAFAEDPRLRRLYEVVREAAVQGSGYELVPHLSLLYADIPLAVKKMAARTVHLDREEMRFDSLKIVVPDPVAGWRDTMRWQTLFRVGLPALRLIRGGRDELRFGALGVTVAPPESAPFPVDAEIVEEDTWQVLGAGPEVMVPVEHSTQIMTEVLSAQPVPLGSVVVREGVPLRLMAVAHDLNLEPSCRPEWVAAALGEAFRVAEARSVRSLALPLLGVRHGRLPAADFVHLLVRIMRERAPHHLRKLWLVVPEEARDEVRRLLEEGRAR